MAVRGHWWSTPETPTPSPASRGIADGQADRCGRRARSPDAGRTEIFIASTGVIGQPFDATVHHPPAAGMAQRATPDGWDAAARAIMTTDTFPKLATRQVDLGGTTVTLNGIAKGAGMIAPTWRPCCRSSPPTRRSMPGCCRTSSPPPPSLRSTASAIDGDTSTSDTLIAFATGAAAAARRLPRLDGFDQPETQRIQGRSRQLDAGAGADGRQGRRGALEVRHHHRQRRRGPGGRPPHWPFDRQFAAGEDGARRQRPQLGPHRHGHRQVRRGRRPRPHFHPLWRRLSRSPPMAKSTRAIARKWAPPTSRAPRSRLAVDVGVGAGAATVYTCDLTSDYVSINADYRS